MRFEKWQALGNDYVIVEQGALPWELTPERVRRLCEPHFGIGADGILLLSQTDDPRYRRRVRIFNPDGSGGGALRKRGPGGGAVSADARIGRTQRRVLDPHQGRADPPHDHRVANGHPGDGQGLTHLGGLSLRGLRRRAAH